MIVSLLPELLHCILVLALRLNNSSFPKPLSSKQERECFEKLKINEKQAFNDLVSHNLRLVAHVVKKYYVSASDQDDLISIGTIGLIKAVKSYDFKKKIKFATYASRCIENEILMYFRQIKKTVNNVYVGDGSSKNENGELLLPSSLLVSDSDVEQIVELNFKKQQLYEVMKKHLDEREQKVLVYRYGLFDRVPLTQNETAKKLHISRSYVSRIEKKALQTLKNFI